MELKNFYAQDSQGNVQPGATCYLYQVGTETLVEGLLDINDLQKPNPFYSDGFGLIQFKAPNGLYDLRIVADGADHKIRIQFIDALEAMDEISSAKDVVTEAAASALDSKNATNVLYNNTQDIVDQAEISIDAKLASSQASANASAASATASAASATASAASALDVENSVELAQSVISDFYAQLASPIGYTQIGVGKTTLDKIVDDSCNIRQYGAIGDGTLHTVAEWNMPLADIQAEFPHVTALTDSVDWVALQHAVNITKRRVLVPAGHFRITKPVKATKNIRLENDGLIDFTGSAGGLTIEGELVALPKLTQNLIRRKTRIFNFQTDPDLSPRDVFIIHNPTDFSWSQHRYYYTDGEYFQVHSKTEDLKRAVFGTPSSDYTVANYNVWKMVGPDSVVVTGSGTLKAPAVGSYPALVIKMCRNVRLEGVNAISGVYNAVYIDRCFNVQIEGGSCIDASPASGDNYGLLIGNSQLVNIYGGAHKATRHAIALGGSVGPGCVPYRKVTIIGCDLSNGDLGNGAGASDMHGNGDQTTYIGCNIDSHANIAGRNGRYIDCRINPRQLSDQIIGYGSEIVGGDLQFINCSSEVYDGDWGTWGVISLSMTTTLREPLTVTVRGFSLKGTALSSQNLGKFLKIAPAGGETLPCRVVMSDVNADVDKLYCLLWIRSDQAPTQPLTGWTVDISNVQLPTGCHYVGEAGAVVLSPVKFNLPTQRTESVVTVPVGAAIITGGFLTYPHPYPQGHSPVTSTYWRKDPDVGGGMYVGNKIPVVGPYSQNNTRIQVALMPADNTTFTETSVGSGVMSPTSVVLGATAMMQEF